MASHDLFKWERISKPRIYSRSMRVTSNNDVQDWIKTVEEASTRAAEATFGSKYGRTKGARHGKKLSAAVVEDTRNLDAAYNEAHDLLEEWVQDKLDLSASIDDYENTWNKPKSRLDVQKEWDRLVDDNVDPCLDYLTANLPSDKASTTKKLVMDDNIEDDDITSVDAILQKMLSKNVLKDNIVQDLGLDDCNKFKDPTTKMKLRHEQVRANREKRTKMKQQKLRELQEKKDAQYKARQLVMKEEQQKAACVKKEEVEIQKQMALIRKQMEDDRKKAEELRIREEKDKLEAKKWAIVQIKDEQESEMLEKQRAASEVQIRQQELFVRMQEIEARESRRNHQILRRHFSAWYKAVIARQIEMGKARALADWKLMLRVWNAWKCYVRQRRLETETRLHEENMRQDHRKWVLAQRHHRSKLLRQCFAIWQVNVAQLRSEQLVVNAQTNTKNKMAAFLEAAASGKLWSARSETTSDGKIDAALTDRKVNELFAETTKTTTNNCQTARSSVSTCDAELIGRQNGASCKTAKIPREPWQVTKKHAKLSSGQMRSMSQSQAAAPATDQENAARKQSPAVVPSSFEHRHNAQQKILHAQQNQLKEQQRLIEDLQYLQRQQLLQQQLVQQQLIAGHPNHKDITTPLEAHLKNLQMVVADTNDVAPVELKVTDDAQPTGRSDGTALTEVTVSEPIPTERTAITTERVAITTERTAITTERTAITTDRTASCASKNSRTKHENFITAMEERANERARLKREREERKRKLELEKRERLAAEAAEKLRLDDELKRQQREEYKEKKRRQKQEEAAKQAELARLHQLEVQAADHHGLAVLRYRGWKPWITLMTMARDAESKATQHHTHSVVRKYLNLWHQTVDAELQEKYNEADNLQRHILLRRCFANWKRCGEYLVIQEGRAKRFHQRKLLLRVFTAWADHAANEKMASWHRERKAKEHNLWRIQRNALTAWKKFPEFQRLEVEREKRREEMRKTVSAMLPDFQKSSPKGSIDLV